jgi:large subunit ribosomal protein L23
MRTPEDIILEPHITEKSNLEVANGKYTFLVDTKATKTEVRNAVEKLFTVKVLKVNTMNYEGKMKRMGAHSGRRANFKKAIVKIDTNPINESYFEKGGKESATTIKYKKSIEEFGIAQ